MHWASDSNSSAPNNIPPKHAPQNQRYDGDSDNLSFLMAPDEVEESSHLSALMELAAQNLELKNQLREVSKELMSLQALVHKHHDEMQQDNQWQTRYWSVQEHQRFLEALRIHGKKNLKAIAGYVGTRSATQVKTHAQKYFQKLARQKQEETTSSSGGDGSGGSINADQDLTSLSHTETQSSLSHASSSYYHRNAREKSSSHSLTSSASPPSSEELRS